MMGNIVSSNSAKLRQLMQDKAIIKVGGAFDAMSAKLVENSGFDAIWAGSFSISAINAVPDASILTMTEFFDAASKMVYACSIPVIADCDTGYGGPDNVRHLVKKYESAGIAGISIEDKVFPKQNSLLENASHQLLSEKDFVEKIVAAVESKQDKDFLIIARVEALISGMGMDEALKRASAYEKAGADAILIHSKQQTPDEIFQFMELWKGDIPIVVVPTTYDTVKIDELISHKVKFIIYANQTLRASYASMEQILAKLINAESINQVNDMMSSMNDIFKLQDMYDIKNDGLDKNKKGN